MFPSLRLSLVWPLVHSYFYSSIYILFLNFIWSDYFALKKKQKNQKPKKTPQKRKQTTLRPLPPFGVSQLWSLVHTFFCLSIFVFIIYIFVKYYSFFLQKQQESVVSIHKVKQHNTKEEL